MATPAQAPFAILSRYPELLFVDPGARGLLQTYVQNASGYNDLVQSISSQGAPGPNRGWARLVPITDQVNRWVLSADTLAAVPALLAEVLQAVRNDARFEGLSWTVPAGAVPGEDVNTATAAGWTLKSLSPRFGAGVPQVDWTVSSAAFAVHLTNLMPRHLGLYAEFLRDGTEVEPESWTSRLPPGVSASFESATRKYLKLVTPTTPIAGISMPEEAQQTTVPLSGASSVRLTFGSFGGGAWSPAGAAAGAIVTAVLGHAVPSIMANTTGGDQHAAWFRKLLADETTLAAVMNAGAFLLDAADTQAMLAALVANVDALLLGPAMAPLRNAINKELGANAVERAAPYLNWTWSSLAGLLSSTSFPLAPSQIAAAPGVTTLELFPGSLATVRVRVLPDPSRGEWPDVGAQVSVSIVDADQVRHTVSKALPAAGAPLAVRFDAVRTGGELVTGVTVIASNGWVCGSALSTLDGDPAQAVLEVELVLADVAVPIGASTRYTHLRKLGYDGGYTWKPGLAPERTATALDAQCAGAKVAVCALVNLTLDEVSRNVGYTWKGSGEGLPSCGGGPAVGVGYLFRNVGVVDTEARAQTIPCSFLLQPYLLYGGDGAGFFVQPEAEGNFLRAATPGKPFDLTQHTSRGALIESPLAKIAVHPAGVVLAVSSENSRIEMLALAPAAVGDGDAPVATLFAGPGSAAGLLAGPVSLAVAPSGLVLVLENGAARVQAFDRMANPVAFFGGSTWFALRPEEGVVWQDITVAPSGVLYILSHVNGGAAPADYRVDLYEHDGTFLSRTTGIAAAAIAVDSAGRLYTLNYETVTGEGGRLEPTVSQWAPSAPEEPS